MSATKRNRPIYDAVMETLRPGDMFVVVALDRAYRSVIDALLELDHLQQRGIGFCSLSQSFDTRTPEGKLLYTVCAALAEWERSIISQRTREGLQAARKRGKRLGRPPKLSAQQIEHVKKHLPSHASTHDYAQVSATLNVSPRTLQRALQVA